MKTTQRDIEKLMPVATMIPTTAAASRCRAKNHVHGQAEAERHAHGDPQRIAQRVSQELADNRTASRVVEREPPVEGEVPDQGDEDRQRPRDRQMPGEAD